MIVVGKISVKAILESRKRDIKKVYLLKDRNDRDMRYVKAKAKGLDLELVSREALDRISGVKNHGGYAIECGPRISDGLDTWLQSYFLIEGVTDPYNLGEILRSLYALGIESVITPSYDFYEHEAKLIRASAGASEKINWIQSDDVTLDLATLKDEGYDIVGAHRQDGSHSILDYEWNAKTCICIGGALRGLSRSVLDLCTNYVRLDYDAKIALSAGGATTVFAYSYYQTQRR